MIEFTLVLSFCEEPEDSWKNDPDWNKIEHGFEGFLTRTLTWPVLPRVGEEIALLDMDESFDPAPKVEQVRHCISKEGKIEVVCEEMEMRHAARAILKNRKLWNVEEVDEDESRCCFLMMEKHLEKK